MSDFFAHDTDPECQETRRPGMPSGRGKHRPVGVRTVHLSISVLPVAVMAALGAFAVEAVLTMGVATDTGRLTLALVAAVGMVVLTATAFGTEAATRWVRRVLGRTAEHGPDYGQRRRLGELRSLVARDRQELRDLSRRLAAGDTVPLRHPGAQAAPGDLIAQLANDLWHGQTEAWNLIVSAATLSTGRRTAQVEVFGVNLARRMQTLSHRTIQGLDELENQVEDPELLKGLFRVDHLTTRMRRQAESLAVIGGAAPRRQWTKPQSVYEVLRSAVAEVEHYNRVKVALPVEGTLDGAAVADTVHLLAELVENATKFAPPDTHVIVRAEAVAAGLAIEIDDRGIGIPGEDKRKLNEMLADPDHVDTYDLLKDGRIGLPVVSALAHRHHVPVRLQTNIYGGTQAVVVIPKDLIGPEHAETEPRPEKSPPAPEPAAVRPAPVPAPGPAPRPEPRPAPQRTDAQRTDAPPAPPGARPELPRRRAQAHLPPELRTPAPARTDDDADDGGHNPELIAEFSKAMRSGYEEGSENEPTASTGEASQM